VTSVLVRLGGVQVGVGEVKRDASNHFIFMVALTIFASELLSHSVRHVVASRDRIPRRR
jgi:hypothetical protein